MPTYASSARDAAAVEPSERMVIRSHDLRYARQKVVDAWARPDLSRFVELMGDLRATVALVTPTGKAWFSSAVPLALRVRCCEELRDAQSCLSLGLREARHVFTASCSLPALAYDVRLISMPGLGVLLAFISRAADFSLPELPTVVTPREREVASLICEGLSTREVAERLGISLHTARRHTERVFTKFGVRRRAALIQLMNEHGRGPA